MSNPTIVSFRPPAGSVCCSYCDCVVAREDALATEEDEFLCRICAPQTLAARDAERAAEDAIHRAFNEGREWTADEVDAASDAAYQTAIARANELKAARATKE